MALGGTDFTGSLTGSRYVQPPLGRHGPSSDIRACRAESRNLISAAVVEADDMRRRILPLMADHWRLALHGSAKAS